MHVLIKSKCSGRYFVGPSRDDWTSAAADAQVFASVQEADAVVARVIACGHQSEYATSRNNVCFIIDGKAERQGKIYDNDGRRGYGW